MIALPPLPGRKYSPMRYPSQDAHTDFSQHHQTNRFHQLRMIQFRMRRGSVENMALNNLPRPTMNSSPSKTVVASTSSSLQGATSDHAPELASCLHLGPSPPLTARQFLPRTTLTSFRPPHQALEHPGFSGSTISARPQCESRLVFHHRPLNISNFSVQTPTRSHSQHLCHTAGIRFFTSDKPLARHSAKMYYYYYFCNARNESAIARFSLFLLRLLATFLFPICNFIGLLASLLIIGGTDGMTTSTVV